MTLLDFFDALRWPRKPLSAAPTLAAVETCPEPVGPATALSAPVPDPSRRCWCCGWPTPTGFCPDTCQGPRLVDGPQDLNEQVQQEYRNRTERRAA